MQKVVGSSPISRFGLTLQLAGFSFPEPFFGATDDQAAREVTVASTFLTT
jgi:hypothetical protein